MHGGPSTNRHECHSQQHQQASTTAAAAVAITSIKASSHPASADDDDRVAVLIVEDERVSRNALRKLLAASGYRSAAFECAEDALREMAARDMPPVALIDVDLPGMSGLDLATRLEELRPDMVKVLITAAGGERIEKFRRDHEVHYIRKPLDFGRLLRLLGNSPDEPGPHC